MHITILYDSIFSAWQNLTTSRPLQLTTNCSQFISLFLSHVFKTLQYFLGVSLSVRIPKISMTEKYHSSFSLFQKEEILFLSNNFISLLIVIPYFINCNASLGLYYMTFTWLYPLYHAIRTMSHLHAYQSHQRTLSFEITHETWYTYSRWYCY